MKIQWIHQFGWQSNRKCLRAPICQLDCPQSLFYFVPHLTAKQDWLPPVRVSGALWGFVVSLLTCWRVLIGFRARRVLHVCLTCFVEWSVEEVQLLHKSGELRGANALIQIQFAAIAHFSGDAAIRLIGEWEHTLYTLHPIWMCKIQNFRTEWWRLCSILFDFSLLCILKSILKWFFSNVRFQKSPQMAFFHCAS